jgi:ssDNA-binding Zn-finger/Zn-ribbon topoisomerase 1
VSVSPTVICACEPMKKHKPLERFDPWRDRKAAVGELLKARELGATLREAAAAAGIHVATLCDWKNRSRMLAYALSLAQKRVPLRPLASCLMRTRPGVPFHRLCPECGADAQVRSACGGGLRFWRCSRWPACRWASWRPRHPLDCPTCRGHRFWSHSRKSVSCSRCARVWRVE